MTTAQKYTFDLEFSETGEILSAPDVKKHFTPEEVEIEKANALEEGRNSVEAEAARQSAAAMANIAEITGQILQRLDGETHKVKSQALTLAITAARKLAAHALNSFPEAEINTLLDECLGIIPDSPQIYVWVPSVILEEADKKVAALCSEHDFEGRLKIRADEEMQVGDYRIDWGSGGVEHDQAALEETIQALITHHLANEAAALDEQPDLFSYTPPAPSHGDGQNTPNEAEGYESVTPIEGEPEYE